MTKRSTRASKPATYAAVGASNDPNIVRFPPEGFTGHSDEVRLGIGERAFQAASDALMSWQAQRRAGFEVTDITQDSQMRYAGIRFTDDGRPLGPVDESERSFSASGEAFITSGTSATLTWKTRKADRHVRVMFTVNEDRRTGFALGTLDENGVVGEELFWVELRADASVWAGVRGFLAAPESGWLGLKQKALVRLAIASSRAQIRALVPGHLPEGG